MKVQRIIISLIFATAFLAGCGSQRLSLAPERDELSSSLEFNDEVDILWVIDNSSSMSKHHKKLAKQMGDFVDTLTEREVNFRIAVTTTDMRYKGAKRGTFGTFIGESQVLDSKTPKLQNILSKRLLGIGEEGSPVEQGLSAMECSLCAAQPKVCKALAKGDDPSISQSMASSCARLKSLNSGFLRPDSLLVVIFLSDEDDSSSGKASDYIKFLNAMKPPLPSGERSWVAHFIGRLPGVDSCSEFFSDSPGNRYIELAKDSGGAIEDICSANLKNAVESLGDRLVHFVTDFYLEKKPKLGTIQVFINGKEIPEDLENGWNYVEELNSIRFNGTAIPRTDAKIYVDYDPETEG